MRATVKANAGARENARNNPLLGDVDIAKVMMGENAFHISLNLISQDMGNGKICGVFQTSLGRPLLAGSARTHVLMLGDAIIRPRLVVASDEFRGRGLESLAVDGFVDFETWSRGDVLRGKQALDWF